MSAAPETQPDAVSDLLLAPPAFDGANAPGIPRSSRGGRPLLESPSRVLERIADLARRGEGLFKVHRTHADLYARARRLFGTWAAAVAAAGVDYGAALDSARRRSAENRRRRARAAKRRRN